MKWDCDGTLLFEGTRQEIVVYLQLVLQRINVFWEILENETCRVSAPFFQYEPFCCLYVEHKVYYIKSTWFRVKVSDYTTYNLLTWGGRFQEENDDIEFWNCVISNILKPEGYHMFLILLFEWIQFYSNFQVSKNWALIRPFTPGCHTQYVETWGQSHLTVIFLLTLFCNIFNGTPINLQMSKIELLLPGSSPFRVWLPSERKWVLFSEIGYQFTSFASLYCNKMWINEEYEQQRRCR